VKTIPCSCDAKTYKHYIDRDLRNFINHRFTGLTEDVSKILDTITLKFESDPKLQEKLKKDNNVMSVLQKMTIYEIDHLKARMAKNFGITETEFTNLISQLKTHETAFFERVFLTHFNDCVAYLMNTYKARHNDAYDATMDTMLEFRERLVQGKISYGNLRYLFTKMASQVYFRKMKSFKSQALKDSDIEIGVYEEFDEHDLDTLKMAWPELGEKCRDLLRNHFYGNAKLTEIAAEQGVSSSTIRKQKERCMNRLRLLFMKNTKAI